MTAAVMTMRTAAETKFGEQFGVLQASLPAGTEKPVREAAFERFATKGLPHRRIEAWHYTDLRSLLREPFKPATGVGADVLALIQGYLDERPDQHARRLVLVDGVFEPSLSALDDLPAGVTIQTAAASTTGDLAAAEALGRDESILALNTAFAQGGVTIELAAGVSLPGRLDVISLVTGETPRALTTRSLVTLGEQASLTLVERHIALGSGDSQGNHAMIFAVGHGAKLDHVAAIGGFSPGSMHLGSCLARLGAHARFNSFTLAATPGITRRQSFVEFAGEHSSVSLNGVSLLEGRAHADTTLVVTHTAAHCESREYYKTILDGESTGVYQGKVIVAPGAQKTDGKMMSRAIFLADGASMFNKPELEIFADDVVCGHGATVGYLDEDQLFYLRSRGIPKAEAQSMLLNAFASDAIDSVVDEAMRENLMGSVEAWLARRQS